MRFSLIPREEKFYDMFEEGASIITRASGKFLEMVSAFDRLSARSKEIKFEEHACDEVIGRIIQALDRSFITPFDREDIHTLATSMDDILDNMEETAHRFVVFRIDRPTPETIAMARIIQECCIHIEQAVRLCRTMKQVGEIQKHLRDISTLEN